MSLKPMTVTVFFPSDMEVGEDRARWYLDHAIRGYWQHFASEGDPIRNMRRCSVSIKPTLAVPDTDVAAAIHALAEYHEIGGTSMQDVEKELGFAPLPIGNVGEAAPVAYMFELANSRNTETNEPCHWGKPQLSFDPPSAGKYQRNVTPLFAAPPEPVADTGVVEAATELVNFAWSAVVTDCTESAEYLNELVEKLRAALAGASQRSQP